MEGSAKPSSAAQTTLLLQYCYIYFPSYYTFIVSTNWAALGLCCNTSVWFLCSGFHALWLRYSSPMMKIEGCTSPLYRLSGRSHTHGKSQTQDLYLNSITLTHICPLQCFDLWSNTLPVPHNICPATVKNRSFSMAACILWTQNVLFR